MRNVEVKLPVLHADQVKIFRNRSRLNAVRCGRRYGKTKMMVTIAADAASKGKKAGLFTPQHKQLQEPYEELLEILSPIKLRASKTEGTIRTVNRGIVDFWATDDNDLAGRGREYDEVLIDEGAFTKDLQFLDIWKKSIAPTMLTRPGGHAWVFSTPNGEKPENFFYKICNDSSLNFKEHYAPTSANPYVLPEELERERRDNHPMVFKQEFLAEFVDWSGVAFFTLDKLTVEGRPVPYPAGCDTVFAVIDSAVKSGQEHDGTAVSYWATSSFGAYKLICLDWDTLLIDGALLENWIPSVAKRCEELAAECRAVYGAQGLWIEDKSSGSILLQQCALRDYDAQPLPAALTAVGKDERALNASGPVWREEVKISRQAYDKTVPYKGATRNHFISQLTGFRLGDKAAAKRADDLFDTFTYAVAIALGNSEGIA